MRKPAVLAPVTARARVSALAFAFALAASACSSSAQSSDDAGGAAPVRVFAASSLTDVFGALEEAFESAEPRYDVELNVAGSASLRAQILDGAPADVFASANESIMEEVVTELAAQEAEVEPPRPFATNRLAIAVPLGNPAGLTGLEDFANPDLFLGLCAEAVPCGSFAALALDDAGIEPSVDTEEADVRSLLTKVATGELDAGIVYATDVTASTEVEAVVIPDDVNPTVRYPIVGLDQGENADGGRAFVSFVFGEQGGRILADHGFGAP